MRTFFLLFCTLAISGILSAQIPGRVHLDYGFPAGARAVQNIGIPLNQTAHFITFTLRISGPELAGAFELRWSENSLDWGAWQTLKDDPHADLLAGQRQFDMVFMPPETRFLQIRTPALATPLRAELIYYSPIEAPDTDPVPVAQVVERNACPCPLPAYVDRAGWGGPPTQQPGCPPMYTTVTHLIVHHQAGVANPPYAAVVGAIWQQHVFTNGWCDIGYNWLIAPDGTIFEGRAGGNNVLGAHFSGHNANTMGVCFLGDYQTDQPTTAALNSLKHLLAWKCCDSNIEPTDTSLHAGSGLVLPNICGHRDGGATLCPGDHLYAKLPEIRLATDSLYHDPTGCDGVWQPANDACANAQILNSNPSCQPAAATTDGATASGLAIPTCSGFTSGSAQDVWFRFTATGTGQQVRVTPLGQGAGGLDPVVAVYRNGCTALQLVDCIDAPGGPGGLTIINLNGLVAGINYWVRVFDFGNTPPTDGRFEICVTPGGSMGTAGPVSPEWWRLFPNPAADWVTVQLPETFSGAGFFRLFSIDGLFLTEQKLTQPETRIALSAIPAGVYMADIQTDAGIFRRVLVLQ